MTQNSLRVGIIILAAIVLIVVNRLPNHITAILMCVAFVIFGHVNVSTAFCGFAGTSFWLIVGVLGIGIAVTKTGLLKRLALMALKLFPGTYQGVCAALILVGTVCQPIMPSTIAKVSIISPVAKMLADTLNLKPKSKEMAGIWNAMYIGWSMMGFGCMSASFLAYMYMAYMPAEVQAQFTWTRWLISMLPWIVIVDILSYIVIIKIYQPKTNVAISKAIIQERIDELGPMSREEKLVAVIMTATIFAWVLERQIGIAACYTALISLAVMSAFGLFTAEDFDKKLGWGFLVFIGGLTGIGAVMDESGLTAWLEQVLHPVAGTVMNNPYVLIAAVCISTYLARFVMVDLTTYTIIVSTVVAPLANEAGYNPWIVMMASYCSSFIYITKYQNANMLVGYKAFGGDDVLDYKHLQKFSYVFLAINLAALLCSIPFWDFLGYMK